MPKKNYDQNRKVKKIKLQKGDKTNMRPRLTLINDDYCETEHSRILF